MAEPEHSNPSSEFSKAEERIENRSAVFKKELGLRDLILTQILYIVGLGWVGTAAKLGPSHAVFWVLAVILFYLPTALVVIYLNRMMPLEGGLYQWAKLGLNDFIAFMAAWNLWLYVIVLNSEIGLQLATNLSYAIGPGAAWMAGSKGFIVFASLIVVGLMVAVSVLGLGVGKWVHNIGGIIMLLTFLLLILVALLRPGRANYNDHHPFSMAWPTISLFSLNILGKMGFGALGGFEYVAIFAGESRSPARTITRSVVIAAPIIALMFILGSGAVLHFVEPEKVDLLGPIPQVLTIGFGAFGFISRLISIIILAIFAVRLAQVSVTFAGNSRLPMVAGWDNLLPAWFTKLHGKYKTPVNSIVFVGVATFGFGLLGIIGVGQQEAYQLLQNASGVFYALTYLVMFLVPLVGLRGIQPRPPRWLLLAAIFGFGMTLLYIVVAVFPIVEVENKLAFTFKVIAVTIAANIIGMAIYLLARRRRSPVI